MTGIMKGGGGGGGRREKEKSDGKNTLRACVVSFLLFAQSKLMALLFSFSLAQVFGRVRSCRLSALNTLIQGTFSVGIF